MHSALVHLHDACYGGGIVELVLLLLDGSTLAHKVALRGGLGHLGLNECIHISMNQSWNQT